MTAGSTSSVVVFSHGLDSSPASSKILALSACAQSLGFQTVALDYQGLDPLARVDKLLACGRELSRPILVGSSLGGHVSAAASIPLSASAMFLLAPAFYMPGYEQYTPKPANGPLTIVHGWRDEIVPVDHSIRYARDYRATLHLLDADHRMLDQLDTLVAYFSVFLHTLR